MFVAGIAIVPLSLIAFRALRQGDSRRLTRPALAVSLVAGALTLFPSPSFAAQEANISTSFTNDCTGFTSTSDKDISHVVVDGKKTDDIKSPTYTDPAGGPVITTVTVKSGTTESTFSCSVVTPTTVAGVTSATGNTSAAGRTEGTASVLGVVEAQEPSGSAAGSEANVQGVNGAAVTDTPRTGGAPISADGFPLSTVLVLGLLAGAATAISARRVVRRRLQRPW